MHIKNFVTVISWRPIAAETFMTGLRERNGKTHISLSQQASHSSTRAKFSLRFFPSNFSTNFRFLWSMPIFTIFTTWTPPIVYTPEHSTKQRTELSEQLWILQKYYKCLFYVREDSRSKPLPFLFGSKQVWYFSTCIFSVVSVSTAKLLHELHKKVIQYRSTYLYQLTADPTGKFPDIDRCWSSE